MALITLNPTSNTTPDPGQGGVAVTGNTNTGHSTTTSSASSGTAQTKTCVWQSFPATAGQVSSVTLKVTHTSSGILSGPSPSNQFLLQYSLNGGGAWTTAVSRVNFTASQGPTTFSVALGVGQDLTQVRVRDLIDAETILGADTSVCVATISGISIEIVTVDATVIAMM